MRSMHLYQTFSGIPLPPPHIHTKHAHAHAHARTHTRTHTRTCTCPFLGMSETYMFRDKGGKLQICNVCL